ncbi:MAG: outer membrane lipoprotein-sorting protein [Spirochaetales bacterium]|nr:outer membrane lipoprotein-sorting protein [Spirochaetales bacterium]
MRTILILLLLFLSTILQAIDSKTILEAADKIMTPPYLKGVFQIKLISRNQDIREIEAEAYQKQVGDNQENRVFIFTFPPSVRGTGLLVHSFFDDTESRMWMYLPSIKRIKRIALETSGGGYFMGSDFTFSDLISRSSEDFNYTLEGEDILNGEPCYLIKAQGKSKETRRSVGYLYTINYYRKTDFMIIGVDYYDLAGELLKRYRVLEVEVLRDYKFPSRVIMENVQTGHSSVIKFTQLVIEDIPDRYFTHRYLQNR